MKTKSENQKKVRAAKFLAGICAYCNKPRRPGKKSCVTHALNSGRPCLDKPRDNSKYFDE